jgi:hypothetical protein
LSCHASGTAIDYNAPRHPNGQSGTYKPAQVTEIRKILAEVGGVVKWGGDFHGTKDEMHFEIHGNAADVKAAAARLHSHATQQRTKPAAARPEGVPAWWTAPHKLGDVSQEVASLCKRLGVRERVTFDADLDNRVRYVQHVHKLPITGVVDAATAKAIG